MTATSAQQDLNLSGDLAEMLLGQIANWGDVTTIILHLGSVFEFKGPFPCGQLYSGFYNFGSGSKGFQGHINLGQIAFIRFQQKPHRGRESYALVFENKDQHIIAKIFLGRDQGGNIYGHQLNEFKRLKKMAEKQDD